jgi:hypothetical protein
LFIDTSRADERNRQEIHVVLDLYGPEVIPATLQKVDITRDPSSFSRIGSRAGSIVEMRELLDLKAPRSFDDRVEV